MERTEHLQVAALRWLNHSGGLKRLRSALVARTALSPASKVLSTPVYINIAHLREIDEELANLVMSRPVVAQQMFHRVVHVASVAITLSLNIHSLNDNLEESGIAEDDHCAPGPLTHLPDPTDLTSLYLDEEDKSHKTSAPSHSFKRDAALNKVDLDLTLQSLASNLPLDSSVSGASTSVLTPAQSETLKEK
ncbi:uncharacterized protein LOC121856670 [Homarus americanus]|uniref:uncharacterized protein LOC121856670 n=1 Tax=Homarus americanus TaxID=6706 RepID=UPI001C451F17|nr:uncharacterized protein LOC121856670 [Homarus americanus]